MRAPSMLDQAPLELSWTRINDIGRINISNRRPALVQQPDPKVLPVHIDASTRTIQVVIPAQIGRSDSWRHEEPAGRLPTAPEGLAHIRGIAVHQGSLRAHMLIDSVECVGGRRRDLRAGDRVIHIEFQRVEPEWIKNHAADRIVLGSSCMDSRRALPVFASWVQCRARRSQWADGASDQNAVGRVRR